MLLTVRLTTQTKKKTNTTIKISITFKNQPQTFIPKAMG